MAISTGGGGADTPMSDINTTPLVDVMLVLLIIFLIAIPVVIQTVEMELPVVEFKPTKPKNQNLLLSVTTTDEAGRDPGSPDYTRATPNGECRIYLNVTPMDSGELVEYATKHMEDQIELLGGIEALAEAEPEDLPEAHIRGDINTPYRCIGGAIFSMQVSGFTRIGFVSSPIDLSQSVK